MAVSLTERVRSVFFEDIGLKALSFVCALLLYSLVHSSQDAQRSMSASLVVTLPPGSENRALINQLPTQVRILLRGAPAKLDDLHADDLGVQAEIATTKEHFLRLEPAMVHAPPGVRVETIDPSSIELVWEDLVTREVPVQVGVVGSPASGFMLKGVPVAEPTVVHAHGPKSEVVGLQYARASAFEVQGLTEGSYQRQLLIDPPPSRVTYDANIVKVTTQIMREVVERPFTKLPVIVLGPAKAKTLPAEVDVRLVCPPEVVRALRPEQVVPHVEEKTGTPTGSESLPVVVQVDRCDAHVIPSTVIVRW
jgi:hypothetical protein